MGLATDDRIKAMLAAELGYEAGVSALPAFWNVIVPSASLDAATYIRQKLWEKGATDAQLTRWQRFQSLHEKHSCFVAGSHRAAQLSVDQKTALDRLDVTKELDALVMIDGELLAGVGGRQSASGVFTRAASGTQRNPLAAPEYDRAYGDIPYPAI